MAYEMKDNTGSLWKNDKKEKDTHPDFKGSIKVNGVEYWMSAWVNQAKDGQKYFGMKFENKEEQRQKWKDENLSPNYSSGRGQASSLDRKFDAALNDDIPF